MAQGTIFVCFGACCCIAVLTTIILLVYSFDSLEVNEYGLDYSSISKTVAELPLLAGIHFLGLGHSFYKFPKTVQTIEFSEDKYSSGQSIRSRTQDGLEVMLEISFQYKLIFSGLHKLYFTYGYNYQKVFEKIAIDTLTESATNYTAYDFFVDRMKIGTDMQRHLNDQFQKKCMSTIDFFQLRSVDLPDKFEDAIQLSEVRKQEIQKAYAEKNRTVVELETLKKSAMYQQEVTVNLAMGDAKAIMSQSKANAQSFQLVQQKTTQGYKSLKNKLKMPNDSLLDFIKSKLVRDYEGSNLVVSLNNPEVTKKV